MLTQEMVVRPSPFRPPLNVNTSVAKRVEHGNYKISATAWSHTYRSAVSRERPRQARCLRADDSLHQQRGLAPGAAGLGNCRCLRSWRWSVVDPWLSCAGGSARPCGVHAGGGDLLSS